MYHYIKKVVSILLCLTLVFALSACSAAAKMTESNITKTVELVEKALREFDTETLKKYINSKTLTYILNAAQEHEQIAELGSAVFESLTMEVKEVDTKAQTVTLLVNNKDLSEVGKLFANKLSAKTTNTLELLGLLSDEEFLNKSLSSLKAQIAAAIIPDNPTEITVKVSKGAKNLVLNFDEAAEDAVSGNAFSSVIDAYTGKSEG